MKELRTEIVINAPQEAVWRVLTQFDQYATWNPFIVSSSGSAQVGQRLTNQMQQGDKTFTFRPKLVAVQPYEKLAWIGHLWVPGLFDGHHYFRLEALTATQTKLVQGEKFSGVLSKIVMKYSEEGTRRGFIQMNRALKERAEQQEQAISTESIYP